MEAYETIKKHIIWRRMKIERRKKKRKRKRNGMEKEKDRHNKLTVFLSEGSPLSTMEQD